MKNKLIYKILALSALLLIILVSCEKETEKRKIDYEITRSVTGFSVNYLDKNGTLTKKDVEVNSAEDIWRYSFTAEPRSIVFVSASYKDINSSINVKIKVDGKVYKQASTRYDTTMYVTVSGVVPEI